MTLLPSIKKILYLTDLSENARQALGYALAAADAHGAEISILHVVEDVSPNAELVIATFLGYESIQELKSKTRDEMRIRIKSRLSELCHDIGGQMPSCRFVVRDILVESGQPASLILEHARQGNFDLLVMGNQGHGVITEIFTGSIARKVIQACKKPVLVIPLG
jgi:nucleotide-binding universal stress UspA family protein